MKEAEFWKDRLRPWLVDACRDLGYRAHFERVENAVAIGTPDVDWCVLPPGAAAGVAGKIELKYAPRHPAREATPVLGRGNGLRRSQIAWAVKRCWAGGRVFCAIGTPDMTWVIDLRGMSAPELAAIELLPAPRLREISAWCGVRRTAGTLPLALIAEAPVGPRISGLGQ